MAWSHEFCLSCDRQSPDGAYCSQACRLADLERSSSGVDPASAGLSTLTAWASDNRCGSTLNPGFYLAPPFDFTPFRSKRSEDCSPAAVKRSSLSKMETAEFWDAFWTDAAKEPSSSSAGLAKSSLTPSSSRSSLSSMHSSSTQEDVSVSDQNRAALRAYADSFDRVRDSKRRVTTS